jgi:hypothetical protein
VGIGKLYFENNEFIVNVNYQFHSESQTNWWGELIPTEYRRLNDGDGYVIELKDGRRGRCSLRKRVNRAVSGTPPLYHYQFRGRGRLE